ncbi:predicted protein [Verticillium alfalfae VaMs.102]|uniref:Predicted protein n=1 Tax=Verticillium alfalfae (strain VaMs.102 / ATCC MYA-4576 / FGSC 10136) TaxID=526221 RepID=C9SQI7_VERA1|nr:predicted protein [Verticillium alfalfae VaMs.102]EEY21112.1 predicted protein [Verticillium alfalfae VaMs.102]
MEDQLPLPDVLPERAGLAELTWPRGSLTVRTSFSSRRRARSAAAASVGGRNGARLDMGLGEFEKNKGEVTPSLFSSARAAAAVGVLGTPERSMARGGSRRVRGFFSGDDFAPGRAVSSSDGRFTGSGLGLREGC